MINVEFSCALYLPGDSGPPLICQLELSHSENIHIHCSIEEMGIVCAERFVCLTSFPPLGCLVRYILSPCERD